VPKATESGHRGLGGTERFPTEGTNRTTNVQSVLKGRIKRVRRWEGDAGWKEAQNRSANPGGDNCGDEGGHTPKRRIGVKSGGQNAT